MFDQKFIVLTDSRHPFPSETTVDVQQELRSQRSDRHEDPELSSWLRLCGLEQDAIDTVRFCCGAELLRLVQN